MDVHENMSGRYWKTCSKDITTSKGWFKKVVQLGLVNLVPVFGQMTVEGYAYEWAHKAAWGVSSPMPEKLYGRSNSKMLRWGWFAIVITFVFFLVPYLLGAIGGALADSGSSTSVFWQHTGGIHLGNTLQIVFGAVFEIAAVVLFVFAILYSFAGIMRMTLYDSLGAGFQLGQIWKMVKRDAGGLFRIIGMEILFLCVICAAASIAVSLVFGTAVAALFVGSFGTMMGNSYSMGGLGGSMGNMGDMSSILGPMMAVGVVAAIPLLFVILWAISSAGAWLTLLVARAVGYWTAQFNVARWGSKDDPLPFETDPAGEVKHDPVPGASRPDQPYGQAQQPGCQQPYQQASGQQSGQQTRYEWHAASSASNRWQQPQAQQPAAGESASSAQGPDAVTAQQSAVQQPGERASQPAGQPTARPEEAQQSAATQPAEQQSEVQQPEAKPDVWEAAAVQPEAQPEAQQSEVSEPMTQTASGQSAAEQPAEAQQPATAPESAAAQPVSRQPESQQPAAAQPAVQQSVQPEAPQPEEPATQPAGQPTAQSEVQESAAAESAVQQPEAQEPAAAQPAQQPETAASEQPASPVPSSLADSGDGQSPEKPQA